MDMNPEAKEDVDILLRKSTQVLSFWMFIVKNHTYTQRAFNRVIVDISVGCCLVGTYS